MTKIAGRKTGLKQTEFAYKALSNGAKPQFGDDYESLESNGGQIQGEPTSNLRGTTFSLQYNSTTT